MSAWMDFSDADEQTGGDLIPKNTIVKVHMKVRPGGYDDPAQGWTGGVATQSDSGAVYLDCEFTVMGGKFNKRKVWSLVGLHSNKGPKWGQMGRSFIRAALESARGIKPDDASDTAMKARRINGLADLDGLEFVAKVDVQAGQDGYDDKNVIQTVIPVTHREYAAAMSGTGVAPSATQGAVANKPASAGQPAWLNS
jgi:hypothetical protein